MIQATTMSAPMNESSGVRIIKTLGKAALGTEWFWICCVRSYCSCSPTHVLCSVIWCQRAWMPSWFRPALRADSHPRQQRLPSITVVTVNANGTQKPSSSYGNPWFSSSCYMVIWLPSSGCVWLSSSGYMVV